MTSSIKEKVDRIVKAKKLEDPVGFQRAEKQECLDTFLANDLRKAGISKEQFLMATGCSPSSEHLSNLSEDFEGYVNLVSDGLDDNIFEPYYQSHVAANHMGLVDTIKTLRAGKKIANRLKFIKVASAIVAVLSFAWGIKKYTSGSILSSGLWLFFSVDLLRVSYNCYIKRYCSVAIDLLGGDARKLGNTLFEMAKSAVGVTDPSDDPLLRLKHDVLYEVLAKDTLSKKIYDKALEMLKEKK